MIQPNSAPDYIYRDARGEDKAEVLAMTANTWEGGDYIEYVFDDWLADCRGRFLVAEEALSGRIAAIDKLSMLSSTEAWFEGLRVHPDFRGRGLASRLQRYMIGEAGRLGARTVRLITVATNRAVHLACYRDGFELKCVVRFWKWEDTHANAASGAKTASFNLRHATPDESAVLYDWWRRSAAWRTNGLAHRSWSFSETSPDEWRVAAGERRLLVRDDVAISGDGMPPASAMLLNDTNHTGAPIWVLSAGTALSEEWTPLNRGLVSAARRGGIAEINGLQPDAHEVNIGMEAAGFEGSPDHDRLCLFELALGAASG